MSATTTGSRGGPEIVWPGISETLSYEQALDRQVAMAAEGRWGWLVFRCRPTITLGKRAAATDVLAPRAELARRSIEVLEVDRGGEVTYHGPGQLLGFPFGALADHAGDSRAVRGFVVGLKERLERFIASRLALEEGARRRLDEASAKDCAGIWILDETAGRAGPVRRKIVSIGLRFSRLGIGHGFALNVQPLESEFALINPCGESAAPPQASLFTRPCSEAEFEAVAEALVDILGRGR